MLKIKDGVDLNKLDISEDDDYGSYFISYNNDTKKLKFSCSDCYYDDEIADIADRLFDLIMSGVVEKVE